VSSSLTAREDGSPSTSRRRACRRRVAGLRCVVNDAPAPDRLAAGVSIFSHQPPRYNIPFDFVAR
jgi:hypothetical protein